MGQIKSRKGVLGLILMILISSYLELINFNPINRNDRRMDRNNSLEVSEAATSVIYDRMFYEWSGTLGFSGPISDSYPWNGYARYHF